MRGFSLILFAAYLCLLVVLSYKLPFSLFFNSFHSTKDLSEYVENSNFIRTKKGKDYFSQQDSTSSFYKDKFNGNKIDLAIGIITIKRLGDSEKHESLGYLFQSASSIDKIVKNTKNLNNSFAFVCNVDLYPKTHKDAQYISQFMPYVEHFGESSLRIGHDIELSKIILPYQTKVHSSVYEKETKDYVYCMNVAASLKPKYILLVEEDAVPHKDFPLMLRHLHHNLLQESHHQNLSFIKFYFPSKWQGFSLRFTEIFDLISLSSIGAIVYCFLSYLCSLFSNQNRYDNFHLRRDFIIGFIISILTCKTLGRQNMIEFRRLSPHLYRFQSSEMCCTQAMLYPLQIVEPMSHYLLSQVSTSPIDLLIWDFAFSENLDSYQIEPNLFYHTGIHSSLPSVQKHPEEFIFSE